MDKTEAKNNLITISEAVKRTSKTQEEILRLGSEGHVDLFYRFGLEKVELGELPIEPVKSNNITLWPSGDDNFYYALPLPREAENHIFQEDFSATKGYTFPGDVGTLLKLER